MPFTHSPTWLTCWLLLRHHFHEDFPSPSRTPPPPDESHPQGSKGIIQGLSSSSGHAQRQLLTADCRLCFSCPSAAHRRVSELPWRLTIPKCLHKSLSYLTDAWWMRKHTRRYTHKEPKSLNGSSNWNPTCHTRKQRYKRFN